MLSRGSLSKCALALSISESPDLAQLGLSEGHVRIALADIARSAFILGASVSYGGSLQENGYTWVLLHEAERYGGLRQQFELYLADPVHRATAPAEISALERTLGLHGRLHFVARTEDGSPTQNEVEQIASDLTAMREAQTATASARVILGGRRHGYIGRVPGVLEEALLAVQHSLPLYVAGGFGGVAADIAVALEYTDGNWRSRAMLDEASTNASALEELVDAAREHGLADTGLDSRENAWLATTYRPSEISSLVCIGLGRVRDRRGSA